MKDKKGYKKIFRVIREVVSWALSLFVFAFGFFTFMEAVFQEPSFNPLGVNVYVVVSNSMASVDESNEQALSNRRAGFIKVNDLVVVKRIGKNDDINVGDIVTYLDDNGNVTIHRVARIYSVNGTERFITRGDANNVDDPFLLKKDDLKGRFLFRIPILGEIVRYLKSPYGIFAVLLIALIEIALKNELRREKIKAMPLLKK